MADSILYLTLDVFLEILDHCSQNLNRGSRPLVRVAIIGGDGDGGCARIAISPSFPNLLYRLFADLQMPAHIRILFQPCSSLGIISKAKSFFKSLL